MPRSNICDGPVRQGSRLILPSNRSSPRKADLAKELRMSLFSRNPNAMRCSFPHSLFTWSTHRTILPSNITACPILKGSSHFHSDPTISRSSAVRQRRGTTRWRAQNTAQRSEIKQAVSSTEDISYGPELNATSMLIVNISKMVQTRKSKTFPPNYST